MLFDLKNGQKEKQSQKLPLETRSMPLFLTYVQYRIVPLVLVTMHSISLMFSFVPRIGLIAIYFIQFEKYRSYGVIHM